MAAAALSMDLLEMNLIKNHNILVTQLNLEYRKYIRNLMRQKSQILCFMQKQLIERRNFIKQRMESIKSYRADKSSLDNSTSPTNITDHLQIAKQNIASTLRQNDDNQRHNDLSKRATDQLQMNKSNIAAIMCQTDGNQNGNDSSKRAQNEDTVCIAAMNEQKQEQRNRRCRILQSLLRKDHANITIQRRFRQRNSKQQYVRRKIHKCPYCQYSSNQQGNVRRHIRTVWRFKREKPFACNYGGCKKKFARKDDLLRHMRRHVGDRPHKCKYQGCNKAFITKYDLRRHIKTPERTCSCIKSMIHWPQSTVVISIRVS